MNTRIFVLTILLIFNIIASKKILKKVNCDKPSSSYKTTGYLNSDGYSSLNTIGNQYGGYGYQSGYGNPPYGYQSGYGNPPYGYQNEYQSGYENPPYGYQSGYENPPYGYQSGYGNPPYGYQNEYQSGYGNPPYGYQNEYPKYDNIKTVIKKL